MRNKNVIVFLAIIIGLIQYIFHVFFSIRGVTPDLVLLFLLYMSYASGTVTLFFLGFLMGILQDLFMGEMLGVSSLANTIVVYLLGFWNTEEIDYLSFAWKLLIFSLIKFTVVYTVIEYGTGQSWLGTLYRSVVPFSIYTVLTGMIFLIFFRGVFKKNEI